MSWKASRSLIFSAVVIAGTTMAAEPADEFSRANCFNNESITYNYWDPPQWRAVFSWHFDTHNGYAAHYVTPNQLAYCDYYTCWYYFFEATRHAAIHSGNEPNAGPIVWNSNRWFVNGKHDTLIPGVAITTRWTSAQDCNLRLDQFY